MLKILNMNANGIFDTCQQSLFLEVRLNPGRLRAHTIMDLGIRIQRVSEAILGYRNGRAYV